MAWMVSEGAELGETWSTVYSCDICTGARASGLYGVGNAAAQGLAIDLTLALAAEKALHHPKNQLESRLMLIGHHPVHVASLL